eukprot:TRINITY_DN29976_c0_g1_i1.p1 TRINITY_DN29976_c0_g1~~TRINITY_DN29976_c0_g1_i1.p1  ORF type:complete len:709 (-),score=88.05 TRINITY_DN29976_c0_g1_i1:5-2131(-)
MCVQEHFVLPESKRTFALAGGIEALIKICAKASSEALLCLALKALWLQIDEENAKAISRSLNIVAVILKLLRSEMQSVVEHACIALGYLTLDPGNMSSLQAADGISLLISTLQYPSFPIQCHAAGALWHAAANDASNRTLIRQHGGLSVLVDLLHSAQDAVAENAAGALWNCVVDESNTKVVHALGGLESLCQLLSSPHSALAEYASGALSKCCELHAGSRVAVRRSNGLPPLLNLLLSTNPNLVCNAALALRHAARNDVNKASILELGGIAKMFQLAASPSCPPQALEDVLTTILICCNKDEAKEELTRVGGIDYLLTNLEHNSIVVREKSMAILANCSAFEEHRPVLVEKGSIDRLVMLMNGTTQELTEEMVENSTAMMWHLARVDKVKESAYKTNLFYILVKILSSNFGEVSVENAAGALHSLTILPVNRDHARQTNAIEVLVKHLRSTNPFVIENVVGALKNCTAQNTINQALLRQLGSIPAITQLLDSDNDNIVREAAMCLRNIAADQESCTIINQLGGIQKLIALAKNSQSDTIRKAALVALQALAQHPSIGPAAIAPLLIQLKEARRDEQRLPQSLSRDREASPIPPERPPLSRGATQGLTEGRNPSPDGEELRGRGGNLRQRADKGLSSRARTREEDEGTDDDDRARNGPPQAVPQGGRHDEPRPMPSARRSAAISSGEIHVPQSSLPAAAPLPHGPIGK